MFAINRVHLLLLQSSVEEEKSYCRTPSLCATAMFWLHGKTNTCLGLRCWDAQLGCAFLCVRGPRPWSGWSPGTVEAPQMTVSGSPKSRHFFRPCHAWVSRRSLMPILVPEIRKTGGTKSARHSEYFNHKGLAVDRVISLSPSFQSETRLLTCIV